MKKSNKKFSKAMILFNILSLIIVLFIIYLLVMWNIENYKNKHLSESLISDANIATDTTTIDGVKIETINVDFNSLLSQNKDTIRMD